jgi:hypothetical protein
MESQKNNRQKSQKRKERAEKRKLESGDKNSGDQPPLKKQRKSDSKVIKLTDEHKKFLGEFFHCTPFYNAPTNSVGVFTGFDLTPCFFYCYPCLLGETTDKHGNVIEKNKRKKGEEFVKATDYVLACGNPVNIFTGLKEAFRILFPDLDPLSVTKWEAYRLNLKYYSSKVSGQSKDLQFKTYVAELGETKVFGGAKPLKTTHLIEDIGVSRQLRAINLSEHFSKVPFHQGLQTPIPKTANVNDTAILIKIRETSKQTKEEEAEADKLATKLIKSKEFKKKINAKAEEYSSESDYTSE